MDHEDHVDTNQSRICQDPPEADTHEDGAQWRTVTCEDIDKVTRSSHIAAITAEEVHLARVYPTAVFDDIPVMGTERVGIKLVHTHSGSGVEENLLLRFKIVRDNWAISIRGATGS